MEATNITKEKLQRANQCVFKKQCLRSCAYYATQVMVNDESYVEHLLNTGLAVKTNNSPAKGLKYGVNLDGTSANTMAQLNPVNGKKFLSSSPLVDSKDKILSESSNIKHQHLLHNQDAQMEKNSPQKNSGKLYINISSCTLDCYLQYVSFESFRYCTERDKLLVEKWFFILHTMPTFSVG